MRDAVAEEGRILSIFEREGVIKLKPGVSKVDARISDVVENPKHLKFRANVEARCCRKCTTTTKATRW